GRRRSVAPGASAAAPSASTWNDRPAGLYHGGRLRAPRPDHRFTLHELAHAATAVRLGDPTPRRLGRLTLDPREHVDPVGLGLLLTVGFGWAKPVVFSPAYIRTGLQQAAVAAAGPLTNLLLAVVFAVALHAELATSSTLLDRAALNLSLGQGGPDVIL